MIRSTAEPIFSEYIGKFQIKEIVFERLSIGTIPPVLNGEYTPSKHHLIHLYLFCYYLLTLEDNFSGLKVYETNEKELIMEPSIKWAGNPNIVVVVNICSLPIRVQVRNHSLKQKSEDLYFLSLFCIHMVSIHN